MNHERLLTQADIAECLGLSRVTVGDWLRAGKIPGAFKLGRLWRITEAALDDYLKQLELQQEELQQEQKMNLLYEAKGIQVWVEGGMVIMAVDDDTTEWEDTPGNRERCIKRALDAVAVRAAKLY
jgi:excisionase family DNA binding protein